MKKINLFLGLGVAAITTFFSSCDLSNNPVPEITFDETGLLVLAEGSTTATISGTVVAQAGLSTVKLIKMSGSSEVTIGSYNTFDGTPITTSDNENYDFSFTVPDVEETITIKVEVTDADDQTATGSIEVSPGVHTYTAILMGAQSNASLGSFLDANEGDVYLIAGANANAELIDIIYYYGSSNLATLCSPTDPTVNGGSGNLSLATGLDPKNETQFGSSSLSSTEFDAVLSDKELSELSGMGETLMTDLGVDDVITFETEGGKKGLVKVTELETGSTGSITITVKVQQ